MKEFADVGSWNVFSLLV